MRAGARARMPLDPSQPTPPADRLKVTPENAGYRDQQGFAYMHHCLSTSTRAHPPAHVSMDMPAHVL
jgi:hypothetical protein